MDVVDMQRRLDEMAQRLLEAEGEVHVLRFERDAYQEQAVKWEMRALELFPEGVEARIKFHRDLADKWRAEAMRLRGLGAPYDGEGSGDW